MTAKETSQIKFLLSRKSWPKNEDTYTLETGQTLTEWEYNALQELAEVLDVDEIDLADACLRYAIHDLKGEKRRIYIR